MTTQKLTKLEQSSALCGTFLWVIVVGTAGMRKAPLGVIELLFLFAPAVIAPLGLALGRMVSPIKYPGVQVWLSCFQPIAAISVVFSFWVAPGSWMSAAFALPWLLFCASVALAGGLTLQQAPKCSLATWAVNIGRIDLAVAGGWLMMSRLGIRPFGIQEPIGLLTAVHFHYTGFATAVLAGALLAHSRYRGVCATISKLIVALVIAAPLVVAVGFVFSPTLKMLAAVVLAISVTAMAGWQLWVSRLLVSKVSRVYVRLSAMSVIAGMVLACIYAIGDRLHRDWLLIPRMASTHGVLNGLGFSLLALLGWTIELSLLPAKAQNFPLNHSRTYSDPPRESTGNSPGSVRLLTN